MISRRHIQRYLENWQDELNSAYLYRTLAAVERHPALAEVYRRLAETEEEHAQFWQNKLLAANYPLPRPKIRWRTRVLATLGGWFGPQFVLPTINALEQVDSYAYHQQPDTHATALPVQERSHARLLSTIVSLSSGGLGGSEIAQMEGRHRAASGNTLRAAVLGANDGLLSNLSLVMGVAGADASGRAIVITGVAGLLAGACSMALGEWLSVQSARELYERQIQIEAQELEETPAEEAEELALIYEAKGLPADQARILAQRIIENRAIALDTLAREELGVDPQELGGSAWVAAFTSFSLFATGAVIPLIPFLIFQGAIAITSSIVFSGAALFIIGAAITLLTGRSVWFSGTRQVCFGLVSAGLTFGIGRILGVSLGG